MKLSPILQHEFALWKDMRSELYGLGEDYDTQEMTQIFASDLWHCYFLKDDCGGVMGFIELSSRNIVDGCLSSPVAYLEGLYLYPQYRGQGLGRKVIQLVLDWGTKHGFSELATDTELSNTEAQGFYSAIGFQETDRVVEYRISIGDRTII